MGSSSGKIRHRRYVIHSSFIRNYTSTPLVDVNNSYEIELQYQILYLMIGKKTEDRAIMKVLFMNNNYSKQKAELETEWSKLLKLNEESHIVHYLGREYCKDAKKNKRCEILCQYYPIPINKIKNITKLKAITWGVQLATALSYAHSLNIPHENLIFSNIGINEDKAVMKNFGFCNYTKMEWYKVTEIEKMLYPPNGLTREQKDNVYWKKKQDLYMWGACVLYLLGFHNLVKSLHSKKRTRENRRVIREAKPMVIETLRELESSGINAEITAALLLATMKLNPLKRPSMKFILNQLEVQDQDILKRLNSICHFCGYCKKRLHKLQCKHSICKKCWFGVVEEEKKKESCEVCGSIVNMKLIRLKCGCEYDKLEKNTLNSTEEQILEYKEGNFFNLKCKKEHEINDEDLEIIFGENKVEKVRARTENNSNAQLTLSINIPND